MVFNIVEYDEFRAKMDEVKDMCNFIPDVSTDEGYEKSKRIALDVGKLLTALESKRKEKKEYFLNGGREVDAQAKAITAEIEQYQLPHKEAYKELDNLRKEREKQRKQALEDRVEHMRTLPELMADSSSDEVAMALESISNEECLDFYEFTEHALKARNASKAKLAELFESKLKHEREQVELAKLRKDAEERARIDREEQIKREASAKAEAEKQQAIQDKMAAEQAKIDAERRAIEAEKSAKLAAEQAALRAVEAEKQAKINADAAAENARLSEVARQNAESKRIADEEQLRAANVEHKRSINKAILDALVGAGLSVDDGKIVITLLAKKELPNVSINY